MLKHPEWDHDVILDLLQVELYTSDIENIF